ncbi:putative bifunctional diguanylate cyclase/phosphodiesterase [Inmirania thermothiophila]|uniref:Diguanylate cyclase (GGDEF)-like protein n=1 Tax=Inmirania thermothiophila TaxID=1750597 RepID=A0A3N1Y5R5_9GAMM|nr:GGDEF domain-containing protein [Inmirania thermothiophila]ROR34154.1 diguanylate cyclase (GGDEF)-like protein [Inmirania thermothiophila]
MRRYPIPLGRWLLVLTVLALAVALAGIYHLERGLRARAVEEFARVDARQRSLMVFETLYAAMRAGWGKDDIAPIIERLNRVAPGVEVRVLRGEPVIRQFGEIPGERAVREADPVLQAALRDGREFLRTERGTVRYVYPVRVRDECLRCHTEARLGDVNGVIDVRMPVGEVRAPVTVVARSVAVSGVVLLLVVFALLNLELRLGVVRPLRRLVEAMAAVEARRDYGRRVDERGRVRELVVLARQFNHLLEMVERHTRELEEYAVRDTLTGLYNRRKFEEFLAFEVQRARRADTEFCLVMFDLDNFKHINDTFGHPVGDLVLREVGRLVQEGLRTTDLAVRLGGDEFAVILPETEPEAGVAVAAKLHRRLTEAEIALPTGTTRVTVSMGVVSYPRNGDSPQALHGAMDVAMYEAKRAGKNRLVHLGPEEQARVMEVFAQADCLRRALDEDRVEVVFQPIVAAADGTVVAYEALARVALRGAEAKAGQFIYVAEQVGLAEAVDLRVVERVCGLVQAGGLGDAPVFVNLSRGTFGDPARMAEVTSRIRAAGVDPARVVFEITEREALPHLGRLAPQVQALREEGFRFALDDFGSGFSSFMYLKYLPVDFVKIEGTFVRAMPRDPRDRALVEHMHGLARRFGLRTIAEFVEDAEIAAAVRELGIDYAQGYHYGRPAPVGRVRERG